MKSRLVVWLVSVCGSVMCAGAAAPANASDFITPGSICQARESASVDLIVHDVTGVYTVPKAEVRQEVNCPVPRTPSTFAGFNPLFFIDGTNTNGGVTDCTLGLFSNSGQLLDFRSFTRSNANYSVFVSDLSASWGTESVYVVLSCFIPEHGNGILRGITSSQ